MRVCAQPGGSLNSLRSLTESEFRRVGISSLYDELRMDFADLARFTSSARSALRSRSEGPPRRVASRKGPASRKLPIGPAN